MYEAFHTASMTAAVCICDQARCATHELNVGLVAVRKPGGGMLGVVPPPRLMPEHHIDTERKSIDIRIEEAVFKFLSNDRVAPLKSDELECSWSVIQSIMGFIKHALRCDLATFHTGCPIPTYPLPKEGVVFYRYQTVSGRLILFMRAENGTITAAPVLQFDPKLIKVLIVRSDQASPMFTACLHLMMQNYLIVWFPDINHVDNNDMGDTDKLCNLQQHKAKTSYLCKFMAGPFARQAGGRNKQLFAETWARIKPELRDKNSACYKLFASNLSDMCRQLDVDAAPDSDGAFDAVIQWVDHVAMHQGLWRCIVP